jgi:peptidoglycan-associated lipoprotein
MLKRFLMAFAMVSLMAGCSSGVKLNKAPVENQNAGSMSTQGAQSAVAPVAVNESTIEGQGPAGSHSVYFDFDKYVVKPEYQNVIENNANYLKTDERRHAVVEGNTDDRGSAEYNLALGQKRAEAVVRALELLGVKDSQLEAISYGKEKPKAQGTSEAARAENRRADIAYR